jgi:hypothetical protein
MKTLVNLVGFAAWVAVYLSAALWAARLRRGRMKALTTPTSGIYRVDRDLGWQFLLLLLGVLSLAAVYLLGRAIG